jgi:mannose-6-phosphate isomerase class I
MLTDRPILIIPNLIPQPTWGGSYIAEYKNWQHLKEINGLKIGQSYELFGNLALAASIRDSASPDLLPLINNRVPEGSRNISFDFFPNLSEEDKKAILGPEIYIKYGTIPILIKFTQALGNSFQLHRKPDKPDPKWLPKAESWYFLEKGKITFGINPAYTRAEYRETCEKIDTEMKNLSQKVLSNQISVDQARDKAKKYISQINPWKYVNILDIDQGQLIDLSGGGLHHSWEEDESLPWGNIVYEIQQDVSDDLSTLRSFDQGKIKDDGTIRPVTINDYFRHLDTDSVRNNISNARKTAKGENLLKTKYYSLDRIIANKKATQILTDSFHHLFILEGAARIGQGEEVIRITKGHSCLVPHALGQYQIFPETNNAIILKTYIDKE